ncbi:ankyrin [Annulohypoxylon maeteangense]|uniref:ankyrin n=1 Tax=Annulohypoxylon maeteangense TaxID=1927788 RepID=UPI002008B32D|nr:ankyrin [Annulohypoxylon maeteangense]KAI0880253.1 ankyrin [Annulohypoxylon maeteangense]
MRSSSTTSRISPTEWEQRKDRIIHLYLNRGLKLLGHDGVIETMKREGFSATKSQYETQLQRWDVRKNMTSKKWTEIFSQNQESPGTGDAREIYLSGRLISSPRLKTAQRRYGPRKRQARNATRGDGHTSLENMPLSVSNQGIQASGEQASSETINLIPPGPGPLNGMQAAEAVNVFNTNSDIHQANDSVTSIPQLGENDSLNLTPSIALNAHTNSGDSFTLDPGGFTDIIDMDFSQPLDLSQSIIDIPLDMDAMLAPYNASLDSLHSSQLNLTGMVSSGDMRISTLPSTEIINMVFYYISKNSPNSSAYSSVSNVARYSLVGQFIADVTTSLSSNYELLPRDPPSAKAFPQILENLVSSENFLGEEEGQFAMLSADDAFECRFLSRLLTSFVNGCAGMGDIRPGGILRFLSVRYDIKSLIFQLMKYSSTYTAKSLAEIMFQAALETDNDKVAELLLEFGFVDANETVCFDEGERYTPLQKAAGQRSFRIMKLLIDLKADVNKSLHSDSTLQSLIFKANQLSTLTEEFLSTMDSILKAGAIIEKEMLAHAINKVVDPRLARLLVERTAFRIPKYFISNETFVVGITKNFNEVDAVYMLELIINGCREFGGDPYLLQLHPGLEIAFDAAISKGYDKLAQLLLPYGSRVDILVMAIENGNQEIIDRVLTGISDADLEEVVSVKTLNAALKSGNEKIISFLEDHKLPDFLYKRRELGQAVTDAIEAGNIAYANKLLDSNPDGKMGGLQFTEALKTSLENDHDDLSWRLMAAGADLTSDFSQSSFYIAIKKRKTEIVRAIFESGIHPEAVISRIGDVGPSALQLILEWGEDSILQDFLKLCSCWRSTVYSPQELELAIEKGGMDLFWAFIEFGVNQPSLQNALEVAIKREDLGLLDELLNLGADPTGGIGLEIAVLQKPSMLKPLLDRVRKFYPRAPYNIAVLRALVLAFDEYPRTSGVIDTLVISKLVDLNVIAEYPDTDGRRTALGIAIRGGKNRSEVKPQDIQLVKKLLDSGGNANSMTTDGYRFNVRQTALLDAIETRSAEMVKLLLQYGARVNEPATFGLRRTPLQGAVETGNLEIIRLLLSNGADVNAAPASRGGGTALQLAAIGGNCTIAMILIENGARFDIPPPQYGYGRWPLESAAENGRLDMIQLLWNANYGQFDDQQCEKAKRLAEYSGHNACRDKINDLMFERQVIFRPQLLDMTTL